MAESTHAQPLPLARAGAFLSKRGWLPQVIAGLAVVLVGGLAFLNHYLGDLYSPDQTAITYLSALQSRGASAAWSLLTAHTNGMPAVDANLVTKDGLEAQLRNGGLDVSGPRV